MDKDRNLAMASGVLAVGEAEAKVALMKRDAMYAGEAGGRKAQVEIAVAQAEKMMGLFKGVQIVPEKTILNVGKSALAVSVDERN